MSSSTSSSEPAHAAGAGRGPRARHRRYAAVLFGALALGIGGVVGVNVVIDPLWHFGGSRLGVNYAFNERISKANVLVEKGAAYDCLIFGSSRATLLDPNRIAGHDCFNLAVSQLTIDDLRAIPPFAAAFTSDVRLVILGVDGYLFSEAAGSTSRSIPDFFARREAPAPALPTYLSLDVLRFSIRTLRGQPPNGRFYDERLVAGVVPDAGRFEPPERLPVSARKGGAGGFTPLPLGPFDDRHPEVFESLRRLFPEARLVAYVPPLNAWYIASLELSGALEGYLDAMVDTARSFHEFYDFSAPSTVTRDASATYDGQHYYPRVNAQVAAVLNGGPSELAIALHDVDPDDYRQRFRSRVVAFLEADAQRRAGAPQAEAAARVANEPR